MRIRTTGDLATVSRGRRLDLGWTQAEVARRVGVSRKWVSDFERGRTSADLSTVLRLLEILDLWLEAGTAAGAGPPTPPSIDHNTVDLDDVLDRYLHRR